MTYKVVKEAVREKAWHCFLFNRFKPYCFLGVQGSNRTRQARPKTLHAENQTDTEEEDSKDVAYRSDYDDARRKMWLKNPVFAPI